MTSCACGRQAENGSTRCARCGMLHTLGLDYRASAPEIKNRYRALVRRWHPDRFQHDERFQAEAGEKLTRFNVAYDYLRRTPRTSEPAPNRVPRAAQPQARTPPRYASAYDRDFETAGTSPPESFRVGRLINVAFSVFFIVSALVGVANRMREVAGPPSRLQQTVSAQDVSSVEKAARALDNPTAANAVSVEGTFRGTTFNTTSRKGASTLLLVEQQGDRISGCLIVAPPMEGSGPFTGFVRGKVVSFNSTSSSGAMSFIGTLASDTIQGSLITRHGDALQQSGVFSFTREAKADQPILARCPKDEDRAVASGKLTMR